MTTEEELKPIFPRPYGPSNIKRKWVTGGASGGILCEWCGTEHPPTNESEPSIEWGIVEGRQMVMSCCGAYVDEKYEEFGDMFITAFLNDFAENPLDSRFNFFRYILPDKLLTALVSAERLSGTMTFCKSVAVEIDRRVTS